MQIVKKLPPFNNVGANLTAVLPIVPQGMTFEKIIFVRGGTTFTAAQVTGIRVNLGGKKIVDVTGANLDDINEYYKEVTTTNYHSLWFADPRARNRDDYLAGALDTSNAYSQFSIEVDIGGATAPTLQAYAVLSAPIEKSGIYKSMFRTLIKSIHAPASAAEFSLPIPIGSKQGALIRALHLFHTNITQLQVVKDGFYLLESAANALNQANQTAHNRTAQSGMISYDPMINDFSSGLVPTLRGPGEQATFEFKATVSASDTITAYSDLIQTHPGV